MNVDTETQIGVRSQSAGKNALAPGHGVAVCGGVCCVCCVIAYSTAACGSEHLSRVSVKSNQLS